MVSNHTFVVTKKNSRLQRAQERGPSMGSNIGERTSQHWLTICAESPNRIKIRNQAFTISENAMTDDPLGLFQLYSYDSKMGALPCSFQQIFSRGNVCVLSADSTDLAS